MNKNLENAFLDAVNRLEKLTPQDVTYIENKNYKELVQYRLNINDYIFQILIKKNGNEIVALGSGDDTCAVNENSKLLYETLKKKARVWYSEVDLSEYTVAFNNHECRVYLDLFSFIQPFVLKSLKDEYMRYIGLDFLTVYSLINDKGEYHEY